MNAKTRRLLLILPLAALLASALAACAASTCQRRDRWFAQKCPGTEVAYSPDSACEETVKQCDPVHTRAFEAYVACLESQNQCSQQAVSTCAQQNPAGVNLMCPRAN